MASDPALLEAFRKQLRTAIRSGNPGAFLGLWMAWKDQGGVDRDDLIDAMKAENYDTAGLDVDGST
jgi:hypothetical protein